MASSAHGRPIDNPTHSRQMANTAHFLPLDIQTQVFSDAWPAKPSQWQERPNPAERRQGHGRPMAKQARPTQTAQPIPAERDPYTPHNPDRTAQASPDLSRPIVTETHDVPEYGRHIDRPAHGRHLVSPAHGRPIASTAHDQPSQCPAHYQTSTWPSRGQSRPCPAKPVAGPFPAKPMVGSWPAQPMPCPWRPNHIAGTGQYSPYKACC
jgi:hypothetical protein